MIKIRTLEPDDLIITPTETFEIRAVLDDGGLALQVRYGTRSQHMSRREFEKGYARGEISIKKAYSPDRYDRALKRHIAEAPDENYCPKAKIRQLILLEYDKAPVGLSDESLRAVICQVKIPPELSEIQWRPSSGTLRRDIGRRGEKGRRPLRLMKRRAGRPSRRIDERVARMFDTTVSWYYRKRHRTIMDAYCRVCVVIDYLNLRAIRAQKVLRLLARPSYELLRTHIRHNECFEFLAQKYGKRLARQRYKGVARGREAKGPLDVVMIDATVIDTILVFAGDGRHLLGRPTITIAIDVCTRMIVGFFITFEPPSIYAVTNCIKHMLMPKEQWLKEKYPEINGIWHAFGKPFLIIFDNGLENVGASLQDALRDLAINAEWAPIRTPQYKAYVERFFDTLNKNLFHKLPGGLPGDVKARRDLEIDPAKAACVTLDELERLVCQFIVEVYQNEFHRGADVIPLQHWTKLTSQNGIEIIEDLNAIDEACGYALNAVLTRQGVQCEGLKFHEPSATTKLLEALQPLASRGRRRIAANRVDVKVKFDPSDISKISVWNERDRSYVRLPNVQQAYGAGMSLWHHKTLMKWAREERLEFRSEEERVRAKRRLLTRIESVGTVVGRKAKRISALIRHDASVEVHEAEPRHDGNSVSVPVEVGMAGRADGGERPDGFLRGRAKGLRTKSQKARSSSAKKKLLEESGTGRGNKLSVENPTTFAAMIEKEDGWSFEQ